MGRYPSYTRLYKGGPFVFFRLDNIGRMERNVMYFTLLFESPEGPTEIYELVFHPCPIWFRGGAGVGRERKNEVCIPPHRGPHYVMGDFRFLLKNVEIKAELHNQTWNDVEREKTPTFPRKVGIICHESGHGTEEDLNLLMAEMKSEGFIPQLIINN